MKISSNSRLMDLTLHLSLHPKPETSRVRVLQLSFYSCGFVPRNHVIWTLYLDWPIRFQQIQWSLNLELVGLVTFWPQEIRYMIYRQEYIPNCCTGIYIHTHTYIYIYIYIYIMYSAISRLIHIAIIRRYTQRSCVSLMFIGPCVILIVE